jgi:phage/plasmid primase-like uncharacterized protein
MGAKITSVEGFAGDDHCITMETDGLKVTSDVYSRTAEIAGWSIVSLLQNLASRRDALDKQAAELEQREALLAAAQQQVETKIKELQEKKSGCS